MIRIRRLTVNSFLNSRVVSSTAGGGHWDNVDIAKTFCGGAPRGKRHKVSSTSEMQISELLGTGCVKESVRIEQRNILELLRIAKLFSPRGNNLSA